MSFPNGSAKSSDTENYTGDAPAYQQTSGTQQTGGWAVHYFRSSEMEVTEGVPAASFVIVSGQDSRLKQVGTRQQYALSISLSGDVNGYTITPGLTDAQGNDSTPVGNYFAYYSEQKFVCTVENGVITPTGRGSCTLEVRWPVAQVNSNWSGATSNPTNFIYASIMLTVTA